MEGKGKLPLELLHNGGEILNSSPYTYIKQTATDTIHIVGREIIHSIHKHGKIK